MGRNTIDADVVLLVEGSDDIFVAGLLLDNISPTWRTKVDVQEVAQMGGYSQRLIALATLPNFKNRVTKVAVLVDSDNRPAEKAVLWAEEKMRFEQVNPTVQLVCLIVPSPTTNGALESVFLQSLQPDNASIACVLALNDCLAGHTRHSTQAQKDKFALMTYINSRVKNPYSRIGYALTQDARDLFDFKHPAFKPLVEFLESLIHV